MSPARRAVAIFVLLAAAPPAAADVAVPIYPDDSGYAQARFASRVAPVALIVSLVAAAVWCIAARTRAARIGAGLFGIAALFLAGLTLTSSPTVFPDKRGQLNPFRFRPKGSTRPTTGEERLLAALAVTAVVTVAGVAVARGRRNGPGGPPG